MANTSIESKKRMKSSLIHVRNIIANKFRKLNRKNVMREEQLEKRYAPITNSIDKLIQTKEKVSKGNKHLKTLKNETMEINHDDDDENGFVNEVEEEMPSELEWDHTFDNGVGEDDGYNSELVPPPPPPSDTQTNTFDRHKSGKVTKKRKPRLQVYHKKNNRRYDVDVSRKNELKMHNVSAIGIPEQQREEIQDPTPPPPPRGSRKKRVVISSEDSDSNFAGYAPKRRKIEVKRRVPTVIISPEDYDVGGYNGPFITKRRKVEIPVDELENFKRTIVHKNKKNAANSRRDRRVAKIKRIIHGRSLQKNFIPYTENIVYEYYDDPNELCDRLRLLTSSKSAGNSNHDQEINSILEELRERHVIK